MQAVQEEPQQSTTLPLTSLYPSKTNPRKTFDAVKLKELAESVAKVGIIAPLIVRQDKKSPAQYEVVAGSRRLKAATLSKLKEVPVIIRVLTDDEVLEIQLTENLQREDVHPLEEANGFQALIKTGRYTLETVAAKMGQKLSYVVQRIQLTKLGKESQAAFWEEKILLGHAIQIARLRLEDQKRVLEYVLEGGRYSGGVAIAQLSDWIKRHLMLELKHAPFSLEDATLNPSMGACTGCSFRTSNAPALFSEVAADDLCTVFKCYEIKVDEHTKRTLEANPDVVRVSREYGKKTKNGILSASDYSVVDKKDPRFKNSKQAIMLDGLEKGKIIQITTEKSSASQGQVDYKQQEKDAASKKKKLIEIRTEVMNAILDATGELFVEDMRMLAEQLLRRSGTDTARKVLSYLGIKPAQGQYSKDFFRPFTSHLKTLDSYSTNKMLMLVALLPQVDPGFSTEARSEVLDSTAKRYDIDVAKIEAAYQPESKTPLLDSAKKKAAPSADQKPMKVPRPAKTAKAKTKKKPVRARAS